MTMICSDKALNKNLCVYKKPKLKPDMKGRLVTTKYGDAVVLNVLLIKQLLQIRYVDGSIGWVSVGNLYLPIKHPEEIQHGQANKRTS